MKYKITNRNQYSIGDAINDIRTNFIEELQNIVEFLDLSMKSNFIRNFVDNVIDDIHNGLTMKMFNSNYYIDIFADEH